MSRFIAGLLAGTIATAVISILMVLEMAYDPAAGLGFIDALAEFFARLLDVPPNPLTGWLSHLFIGIFLWGGLYALINPQTAASPLSQGLQFGLIVWLVMMTLLMPLAGKGLFAWTQGPVFMLMALVYQLIYGIVLTHFYSRMLEPVRAVPKERLEQSRAGQAFRRPFP